MSRNHSCYCSDIPEESQSHSVAFSGEEDDPVCCAGSCFVFARQTLVSTYTTRFFSTNNSVELSTFVICGYKEYFVL
jgi:hypothetical protein